MEINKASIERLQSIARHSRSMIKKLRQTFISPFAYKPDIPREPMKRLLRKSDSIVKGSVKK